MLLPNQSLKQTTDDLEKDIEDEFMKVNELLLKLFKIIAGQIETLEDVCVQAVQRLQEIPATAGRG